MSKPEYPNLELIEYKFIQQLHKSAEWEEKVKKIWEKNRFARPEFSVNVFPQIWGSTCTAFDVCKDGSPAIGGMAMTKAYTTVIEETLTETFGVFIGDKPCYMVTDAPEQFFSDLAARSMASLSEAKKRY